LVSHINGRTLTGGVFDGSVLRIISRLKKDEARAKLEKSA
jgi:hypothetical protein